MFECNDNNVLLILGIGIIVLILLKLIYSNNDNSKKHYRNLNYENNNLNNYEDFRINSNSNYKSLEKSEPVHKTINNFNHNIRTSPIIMHKSIENFDQSEQSNPNPNPNPNPNSAQLEQKTVQSDQKSTQNQISISVPIINDEIFNPNNTEFDYGDANNSNYTLNVKDNPTEVKSKQDKLSSSDLLPVKSEQKWFENPDVGIKIEDANLLADAIQKVGVDTVGQTKKNPSYDIRGTVPCPKFQISPWNNSTIEPDYNLKSLY